MSEEKIASIYDSLSDNDKRIVGLIGVCFLRGFSLRFFNFFDKLSTSNKFKSSLGSK